MKQLFIIVLCIGFVSCKDAKKSELQTIEKTTDTDMVSSAQNHPGKKIIETECYICHNPKAPQSGMIAPPMIAVKRHYIDSTTTKEEFTEALQLWINDPEAVSKMPGAQKKFGKMPYLPYPEKTITQIADYMYDYEIEKPKWFETHFEEEHGKGKGRGKGMGKGREKGREKGKGRGRGKGEHGKQASLGDIGLGYALATKAKLGKNLIRAINEKGTVEAIEFCNTKAVKINDSMSLMKNAIIKRVSDKPRNLNNQANKYELAYIETFKNAIANGNEVKPIIVEENGQVHFYAPITTNTMCLQCHGKPNVNVKPETLAILKSLYPKDKALGYDVNEVRGIWAINFERSSIE